MSQSGSWVPKGIDQRAREAARDAAVSEGLTLGEYLDRLMKASDAPQPNEIPPVHDRRPRTETASEALEKLARRIEATEARSALAITGMDATIHELAERLDNTQHTTSAIAGHVEGMIEQLRDTHEALKQKVRRLEEDNSQQENLEALKALESALGKLANHVYEESALAQQEAQAIKGRVESGFLDIIERVESIETRVTSGIDSANRQVKEGVEQAALRAAGVTRQLAERVSAFETGMEQRLARLGRDQERLEATETRLETIESDVSGALESMEVTLDRIQDRLNRAEGTTDAALKNLESTFSNLDARISDVAGKIDPDLADRLRCEFEARFEEMMSSVRETVDAVRQELAEEINRTAIATTEAAVSGINETLGGMQERLEAGERRISLAEDHLAYNDERIAAGDERHAEAIEKVSAQVANLGETFDARLAVMENETLGGMQERLEAGERRISLAEDHLAYNDERIAAGDERHAEAIEKVSAQVANLGETFDARLAAVEAGSDTAASEAVREEIERLGKTVGERIDELAENLTQRVADSESRSASAIEQIGDQVAAATNRLQARQNEAIKTLAEQVDENRKKADARLSDALANVSERLERMQAQATESLSPVQKAIASLAARLESLEDITAPPFANETPDAYGSGPSLPTDTALAGFRDDALTDTGFDEFEDFDTFEDFAPHEEISEPLQVEQKAVMPDDIAASETESIGEHAGTFEPEEASAAPAFEDIDETAEEFEAGIETWDTIEEETGEDAEQAANDEETSFEDDFDAIRAAVEGLSFAHQEGGFEDEDEHEEEIEPNNGNDAESLITAQDASETEDTAGPDTFDELEEFLEADDLSEDGSVDDDPLLKNDAIPENENLLDGEEDPGVEVQADESADAAFSDPLDGLDDAHTEARESDIFDDEEFEVMELAPDAAVTKAESDRPLDADTADYLTRARKAAMSANFGKAAGLSVRPATRIVASGSGSSRLPLIAAVSAVAVAGMTAGGYLYIRGKQDAPVQRTPADTYVDPGTPASDALSLPGAAETDLFEDETTAGADEDLFDQATPDTTTQIPAAAYPPVPPVVTVEAAAASGNSIAQYQLAQDKLAAGDFSAGADLMRKAAQKGLPIAQYALAKLHEKGTGVPKDLTLAREWTEKAAIGGNVKAMHDLAVFMAEGDGGEQTYAGAVEWFRKGAEYGVVDSQYNLGVLYEQGLGISPNLTESLFWFDIANRNGDGGAPAKIAELIERVSPEAAAQARSRAASWQPAPANGIANGRFGAQPWNMGNPLQVRAIQNALNTLGYDVGAADGIMGSTTAMAIRDYQAAHGLPVTGTVTPALIETLNAGAAQ